MGDYLTEWFHYREETLKAFEGWYHAMWQISAMTRVIRATQAG
jgi:hypothetical protein